MNTTELIELARELATEQIVPELEQAYYTFTVLDLKLFTQRIEQPLQQRIAELADTAYASLNAKDKRIEQLREALYQAQEEAENDRLKQRIAELERLLAVENERAAVICTSIAPSKREFDARFYDACYVCADAIRSAKYDEATK